MKIKQNIKAQQKISRLISNHPDFSWQAQAMGNCGWNRLLSQFYKLHHPDYPQFRNQFLHPSSYDPLPQKSSLEDTLKEFIERTGQSTIQESQSESSLEDTLKAFMHLTGQSFSDVKNVTLANTSTIKSLESLIVWLLS